MQGKILDYSSINSSGVIGVSNGNKYSFVKTDLQEFSTEPKIGQLVDFEALENEAKNIYLDLCKDDSFTLSTILSHYKKAFRHYFDFSGTTKRAEFWYFHFVNIIAIAILTVASAGVLGMLYNIIAIIPALSIGARRLHDTGKSAWWQLLILVPIIGIIVLIYLCAKESKTLDNKYL